MSRPLACDHQDVDSDSPVTKVTTLGRRLSCLRRRPERDRASSTLAVTLGIGQIFAERSVSDWKLSANLPLNAGGAALGERFHLLQRRHGDIAGKGRQQSAVRPAEAEALFGRGAGDEAEEQSRRAAVPAPDAAAHVHATRRTDEALPLHPT